MKPKLIILNGPLGIGKSTLAGKFADDHPLTLRLDIDEIRTHISHWRDNDQQSAVISKQIALAMATAHLSLGHSVIVPQIIRSEQFFKQFDQVANEASANLIEVLLLVDKEEAIKRFKERSYAQGHTSGFRPGGLIDIGGREAKLAEMYNEMIATVDQRPNTIRIEPEFGKEDETYKEFLGKIQAI